MKVAYITAGAAGMYCGSCLHDNTLAASMQRKGHEVALVPTYTPIRTDEADVSIDRVFYGAINVYLEQKSALFRHTPWIVDRLLERPGLLNWVSSRGASTNARNLGALTLSMLQGEHGKQSKELDKLVEWLAQSFQPDIVHLTNSMFLGMARRIRAELAVPVLCSLQGEDIFLEQLEEPWLEQVRATIRERAADVDGFVANSQYYVDYMVDYLRVPRDRMHVVPLGLKLDGHGEREIDRVDRPFMIAYLARICPEKGLHALVEAFRILADEVGSDQVRLRIAGYLANRDQAYFEGIMEQVRKWGLERSVDYVGEVDRGQKIEFLATAHLLCVPTTYREPKGLYVLEALANGVPVVLPRHGAFPELIESTGGGVLVEPESTSALVRALRELMDQPDRLAELGRRGKVAVHRDHGADVMADATLNLYRRFIDNDPPSRDGGAQDE